jgi:hypothetical protein
MENYEKLGVFYLGREYDLETRTRKEEPLLYDSKDLVTHAVCVGMTGSGKTGLCICLLEEAVIDHIPAIVIDPKGDLSNLLLAFPDLRPDDFLPWIQEQEAAQQGITAESLAVKKAELWKKGLQEWDQDGARIAKFKAAADFAIYTPGSNAGTPVSILKSFSSPPREVLQDSELLREKITTTANSLLSLLKMEADPLTSREHILISTILDQAWQQGIDLDLADIIQQIQNPQIERIGVIDLESFFPAKERFQFAMAINHLLASPGFDLWFQGEALDIGNLLYSRNGKPRISIFSIAHLSESERMFFVTLLLTQVLGWIRTQSGTGSLRAILYMDEIFGYFPPVANPPSKQPLLTLLKQARAYGLGIVLATQNPVDLDYKGLSNAGTWFIGRLQTERDKERLLEGLEGVNAGLDRTKLEQILSNLSSRIFLMNNVHEQGPVLFESRWALSYLAGPLTRAQIQKLRKPDEEMEPVKTPETRSAPLENERPVLPPQIEQYFLPVKTSEPADHTLIYIPKLWGRAKIFYVDSKIGTAGERDLSLLKEFDGSWEDAETLQVPELDLSRFSELESSFAQLPDDAMQAKSYTVWTRAYADWIYQTQTLKLWKSNILDQISRSGESERDFRIRLQQFAHEERDRQIDRLRQKYATKITSLQDRIRRAQQTVEREKNQASQQKMQTAISFGTTVLGALFGRKKFSTSTLGRATTAARGVGRTMKESEDIARAEQSVIVLQKQLATLEEQLQLEIKELAERIDPQVEVFDFVEIRLKKTNINVKPVSLVWVPHWKDPHGNVKPA